MLTKLERLWGSVGVKKKMIWGSSEKVYGNLEAGGLKLAST